LIFSFFSRTFDECFLFFVFFLVFFSFSFLSSCLDSRRKSQPHKPSSRSTIQTSTGKMSNVPGARSPESPVALTMPRYSIIINFIIWRIIIF
jgi:hypothetical protein